MKYFLIILGTILIILFAAYKFIRFKMTSAQESAYRELSTLDINESQRYFEDSIKLPEVEFWKLIEDSKKAHPSNFEAQLDRLTIDLASLNDEQIIGFERTLREKVIELWNNNVKALYQIIYGEYISTDVFIYFRFWIISNGEDFFQAALINPDELADVVTKNDHGESLLFVADEAFLVKNDSIAELELPSDLSRDVDYEFGLYKMTGEYIDPDDFDTLFPKLTKKF